MLAARAARPTNDVVMTQRAYDRLHGELLKLTTNARRALAERLHEARGAGANPAENSALIDALDESVWLEQRIGVLKARLAAARVGVPTSGAARAAIGTRPDPARRRISIR